MSCKALHRKPFVAPPGPGDRPGPSRRLQSAAKTVVVTVLVLAPVAAGCGRKGDPLPPLREPDPVAETASGEAAATEDEVSGPETGEAAPDEEEEGEETPDDEDNDGTPP